MPAVAASQERRRTQGSAAVGGVHPIARLQRLAGNQEIVQRLARLHVQRSPLTDAADHVLGGEYDAAATEYLKCTDAEIKSAVATIEVERLRDLRMAADRVGGGQSHRLRTPILERELGLALKGAEWNEYARLLNGFNDTDIKLKVADPSFTGDMLTEIREAADRVNGAASFRIRAPILERQFGAALATGKWGDAAGYLNGFNDADITTKFVPQIADEQLTLIHQGALQRGHKRLAILLEPELTRRGSALTLPLDYDVKPDDPANPGLTNLVLHDERHSGDYLDNRVRAVAVGIYLPGYLLEVDEIDRPVVLPWEYVLFGGPVPTPVAGRAFTTRDEALTASRKGPPGSYAYYTATHRLSVPTIIHYGTCPRLVAMIDEATQQLQNQVQYELTVLAVGMVMGIVVNVAGQLAGVSAEAKALKGRQVSAEEAKATAEAARKNALSVREPAASPKPQLRPARPGDYALPMPGETPEMYAERTEGETWHQLPEPARKLRIESAKRTMAMAKLQYALRDPNAVFNHYLTSEGYEQIMLNQQLRSGAGQQGFGHGTGVRAMGGSFTPGAPQRFDAIHLDFKVPNPPVQGNVEPFHYMGDGVMWPLPEGQMLPVEIQRVGYPNGAFAERGGSRGWVLTPPGAEPWELTLEELLRLGKSPH